MNSQYTYWLLKRLFSKAENNNHFYRECIAHDFIFAGKPLPTIFTQNHNSISTLFENKGTITNNNTFPDVQM